MFNIHLMHNSYTDSEIRTWGIVYDKVMGLVPTHACHEYQYILPVMREKCGFSRDSIPQMSHISDFLKV
jgi:phenylalanine-4-hydroxylase